MKTRVKVSAWMMLVLVITMLAIPGYLTFTGDLVLSKWQVLSPALVLMLASGIGIATGKSVAMSAIFLGSCFNILIGALFSENLQAIVVSFLGFIIGLTAGGYFVAIIVASDG